MEIRYRFAFDNGEEREFLLRFDPKTLELLGGGRSFYPAWTRLEHQKCPDCPLQSSEQPNCPAAERVADVIETFKGRGSAEPAEVVVSTGRREYRKRVPTSEGVSALLGVLLAASACPVMSRLRPMVRTHLPFASHEETMYRLLSMHMVAQYFRAQKGLAPDWQMKGLLALMERIRGVNRAFCARVREVCTNDANINALVLLDCFAGITEMSLKAKSMQELERLFEGYLQE